MNFEQLSLDFARIEVILKAVQVFRLINFKESKYEIAKSSSFTRRRSHYDFRSFNFFGAGAGELWRR